MSKETMIIAEMFNSNLPAMCSDGEHELGSRCPVGVKSQKAREQAVAEGYVDAEEEKMIVPKYSIIPNALKFIFEGEIEEAFYSTKAVFIKFKDGSIVELENDTIKTTKGCSIERVATAWIFQAIKEKSVFKENFIEIVDFIQRGNKYNDFINPIKATNLMDSFMFAYALKYPQWTLIETDTLKESFEQAKLMGKNRAITENGFEIAPYLAAKTKEEEMGDELKYKTPMEILEMAKRGELLFDFDLSEEERNYIPNLSFLNDYIPTKEFKKLCVKIQYRINRVIEKMELGYFGLEAIGDDFINCILKGDAGSGKSVTIKALCATFGYPMYIVTVDKNTERDTFQGETLVLDGKLQNCKTNFIKGYKGIGAVVFEEINLGNANVIMSVLGQAIEPPFVVMEKGIEPINRNPLSIVFATYNVNTNGSLALNEALKSRFYQKYRVKTPTRKEMITMLNEGKGFPLKNVEWVLNAYESICNHLKATDNEEFLMEIGNRSVIGALKSLEEDSTAGAEYEAITDAIVNSFDDEELCDELVGVIENLPSL